MNKVIRVPIISAAWIKEGNNYMNIEAQFKTFFPDDCFIARGTGKENLHLLATRGIDLEYEGANEVVRCFLELRDSGQFRPSNRGSIKSFYQKTEAKLGDTIVFTQVTSRRYRVTLDKSSQSQ